MRAEPRHVITALLVKFSEAIRSNMTGSCSSRDRHPGSVVGIDIFAVENSELSAPTFRRGGSQLSTTGFSFLEEDSRCVSVYSCCFCSQDAAWHCFCLEFCRSFLGLAQSDHSRGARVRPCEALRLVLA